MNRKIILLSLLMLGTLASCKKETSTQTETKKTFSQLEKAEWYIGEWANASADGELTERWKKVNDSVFFGESYFVTPAKDTVFSETVALTETNGILSYTVTVPNQNDEKPVRFDATSVTDTEIIYENPKHDFPNKIVYRKVGNDSLVAEIFGLKKGEPATEKFAMKKLK